MKKTLLLMAIAITSIHISANAQPITGNITIQNNTDCEIAWNAWAYCESQCNNVTTWYNSGAMRFLAANTSTVMYDQSNYPWFGTNPTCSDFRWSYVDINVQCGGGYLASPVKAEFELCGTNFLGGLIARNCCSGQDVFYNFTIVGADIIVSIDY